ncbi:MAG: hypothetical protein WCV71_03990 [Patescibacteria group bacterium]
MKKTFLFLVSIFLLFSNYVLAAPAPHVLVINDQTKQCDSFWAGDEFGGYDLNSGWEGYMPKVYYYIDTPFGTCPIVDGSSYQDCCKQLGLKTIDYKQIPFSGEEFYLPGSDKSKRDDGPYRCVISDFVRLSKYTGISVNQSTRECTAELNYYFVKKTKDGEVRKNGASYECLANVRDWHIYRVNNDLTKRVYETPYGNCELTDTIRDQNCCEKFSLTWASGASFGAYHKAPLSFLLDNNIIQFLYYFLPLLFILIVIFIVIVIRKKRSNKKL